MLQNNTSLPVLFPTQRTSTLCAENSTDCFDEYEEDYETLTREFAGIMAFIFILIMVTSAVANTILISVIISSRKLYSITHVFIVNLAIGDLITTFFVIPFDINFMITGIFTNHVLPCAVMQTTFLMSLPLAVWNLYLLTTERFITISFPFKREKIFTKRNIIFVLLTTWLYTLIVSMFPLMYNPDALIVEEGFCGLDFPTSFSIFHSVVNFILPVFGIIILNILIFRIAKAHEIRIEKTLKDAKKHQRKLLSFRKGAKRIMLLVGVCVFCTLTFIAMVMWNILCNVCHPRQVTWIVNAINYSSVSINPILYGVLNKSIRKEFLKRFRHFFLKTYKHGGHSLSLQVTETLLDAARIGRELVSPPPLTENMIRSPSCLSDRSDIILPLTPYKERTEEKKYGKTLAP